MNKILQSSIAILFFTVFITACTTDKTDSSEKESSESERLSEGEFFKPEIISDIPWTAVLDSNSQKYSLKKSELVDSEELDSTNVVEAINRKYPENTISWDYQRGDTAFVRIADADYLTQQSGSMGAQVFLAESTYSLTEIPGINVVFYRFQIGDHASPGPYTRKSFDFSMPYKY